MAKLNALIGKVRGIGQRRCANDWNKRSFLLKKEIRSIVFYDVKSKTTLDYVENRKTK